MIKLQHIMHASGSALRCNVSVNGEICTKTWRFKKKKKKGLCKVKGGRNPQVASSLLCGWVLDILGNIRRRCKQMYSIHVFEKNKAEQKRGEKLSLAA